MSKPLIAIVNDDTAFLELMHDLLTEEGYQAIIEKERGDAPKVIRDKQPALIILDIRMDHPESGMQILEVIRLDPKFAKAHDSLGVILCDVKQDYDGAITAFKEAIRLNSEDADFHYNLGNALFRQGRRADSRWYARKCGPPGRAARRTTGTAGGRPI